VAYHDFRMGGVEVPQAQREVGSGEGVSPSSLGKGSGDGAAPSRENFSYFLLKIAYHILTLSGTFIS